MTISYNFIFQKYKVMNFTVVLNVCFFNNLGFSNQKMYFPLKGSFFKTIVFYSIVFENDSFYSSVFENDSFFKRLVFIKTKNDHF